MQAKLLAAAEALKAYEQAIAEEALRKIWRQASATKDSRPTAAVRVVGHLFDKVGGMARRVHRCGKRGRLQLMKGCSAVGAEPSAGPSGGQPLHV
jgi:hypothetical protein